jgi:hypothetical protein
MRFIQSIEYGDFKVTQEMQIKPLTRKNKAGELYERLPEVENQIRSTLALDRQTLRERIKVRDVENEVFLQEECLVYLIRHFRHLNEIDLIEDLSNALIERIKGRIGKYMRFLDVRHALDGYTDAVGIVFSQLLNIDSDACDFAQVRFWVWLKARVTGVLDEYTRQQDIDAMSDSTISNEDGESVDIFEILPEGMLNGRPSAEVKLEVWDALNVLNDIERQVVLMRIYGGWEIENANPDVPTISRHFNVTSRTIRNWLNQATKKLTKWQEGRKL